MAVKHFTGVALDDPDPECVRKPETGSTATLLPLALKPRAISQRAPAAARPGGPGPQP
jgi:hypothetical protein